MSPFENNIFELQPLEIRRLLTTASVSGGVLNILGTGGAETIQVNLNGAGRVTVTGVATTFAANTVSQISIQAGGGNDTVTILNGVIYTNATITGNDGNDTITGGRGADVIYGAAGNDNINGGVGDDWLDGNAGNDTMAGGDGKDTASYADRGGASTIRVTLDNASNDGDTALNPDEADNVQTEQVHGGAGNDTMTGTDGAGEFFFGNGGNDVLNGNAGNDQLTAGAGADNLQGGLGDDYLHAQNNDRDTVNGGTGPANPDNDLGQIDGLDVSGIMAGLQTGLILNGAPQLPQNPADLDPTYGGGDGKVTDEALGFDVQAAAVDSLGRVVYVGTRFGEIVGQGYGNDMIAIRYNADGSRDTSFGTGGQTVIDFSDLVGVGSGYNDDDAALGVVIAPNDGIFVVGRTYDVNTFSDFDTAVAKLSSAGLPDSLWGSNGRVTFDASNFGADDQAFGGAVQTNGAFVGFGRVDSEGSYPFVFRLRGNGVLDVADSMNGGFSGDGIQDDLDMARAGAVALQSLPADDGAQRVVVAGYNFTGEFVVQRFLPNGSDDTGFGTGGTQTQDFGGQSFGTTVGGMVVDSNQDIVVAGAISGQSSDLTNGVPEPDEDDFQMAVLAKYAAANGAPVDAASHQSESGFARFNAVTVDAQGRYVAVGVDGNDFLVARLTSAMQPDNSFGIGGVTFTDFSEQPDEATATRVLSTGRIMAAGTTEFFIPPEGFGIGPAIARYLGVVQPTTPPNNEQQVTEVEHFGNYQETHGLPLSPRMQAIKNAVSNDAWNTILWQPDDNGIVRIVLDDRNNVVKFGTVIAGDGKLNVTVNIDGKQTLDYDPTTTKGIEIYALGGNDCIQASNSMPIPLLVDAGAGNDIVVGGSGNDIVFGMGGIDLVNGNNGADAILGGAGLDGLYGDGARDIIIGGKDADLLIGGADEDIEIGGTTSYDNPTPANIAALKALIAEWSSTTTNNGTRVAHLRGTAAGGLNGTFFLRGPGSGQTVFDDGVIDVLTNDSGRDWFFYRSTGNALVRDQILGGVGTEERTLL